MSFKSKYTGKQIESFLDSQDWEYIYNSVGDIVYYNATSNTTDSVSPQQWNVDLGIPMGIIVIPSGVLGMCKICSLYSTVNRWGWSNYTVNFDTGWSRNNALIPSDMFTNVESDDPLCSYSREVASGEDLISSPWFGKRKSKKFQLYSDDGSGDEWFSLPDTIWESVLLQMWDDTGLYNNWRVPDAVEIAFLMSRLNVINNTINILNQSYGDNRYTLIGNNVLWTISGMLTTDPEYTYAYTVNVATGEIISEHNVNSQFECRPFCDWSASETPTSYFYLKIKNSKDEITNLPVRQGWMWGNVVSRYGLEVKYGIIRCILFPEYNADSGYWHQIKKVIYSGEQPVLVTDIVEENTIYTVKDA